MDKIEALEIIADLIETTNNGKLLKHNIPADARVFVPLLIADGSLKRATFMRPGDAVKNI